jgi:hypothetical protein
MQTTKALVGLVIGLGAIILMGMGLLVYGFVQKAADPSFSFFSKTSAGAAKTTATGVTPTNITVPLPAGTSVVSVALADALLMVHTVDEEDNSAILFLDPIDGHIVRRIAFGGRR